MTCQHLGHLVGQRVISAQVGGECGAHPALLAVLRGLLGEELVYRVIDLMAGAGDGPAGARDGHRLAGQHQRVGEHLEEARVRDRARLVHHGLGGGPGHRRGEAVHLLAGLAVRKLPVGQRAQVRQRLADAGPDEPGRGLADQVEVDDDTDRVGHAVGAGARVVLQGRDRRADPVVREVGGDRDQRHAEPGRGVLRGVDDLAAADGHERVVRGLLGADPVGEVHRVVQAGPADGEPADVRGQAAGQLLAQPGA